MSENLEMNCPSCKKDMLELESYPGLWSCGSCKKVWIEEFESDFEFGKVSKLKIKCPSCEEALSKARDEKGVEKFIFCEQCGGLQLSLKQTFMFQNEELTKEVKKSFKYKPVKTLTLSQRVYEAVLFYFIFIYYFTTIMALSPEAKELVFGSGVDLKFNELPILGVTPDIFIYSLLLIPMILYLLKGIRIANIILWIYLFIIHLHFLWVIYPIFNFS